MIFKINLHFKQVIPVYIIRISITFDYVAHGSYLGVIFSFVKSKMYKFQGISTE